MAIIHLYFVVVFSGMQRSEHPCSTAFRSILTAINSSHIIAVLKLGKIVMSDEVTLQDDNCTQSQSINIINGH